ncbi:hypothetical protein ALC56_06153, partial [Trachymyrmex septentrionalis]
TLPNPFSRSFRIIGARNNFPAIISGLRYSTYTYTLSIRGTKAKFRVYATSITLVSSRETGRQSLPTFSTTYSSLLLRTYPTLVQAASSTDTSHAFRMTNARPPWQRGRRKPTKDRRRKKERSELSFKRERDGWEREIRRIQGEKTKGKKANVLVQRPCRLVRAPPPLALEFTLPRKLLSRPCGSS